MDYQQAAEEIRKRLEQMVGRPLTLFQFPEDKAIGRRATPAGYFYVCYRHPAQEVSGDPVWDRGVDIAEIDAGDPENPKLRLADCGQSWNWRGVAECTRLYRRTKTGDFNWKLIEAYFKPFMQDWFEHLDHVIGRQPKTQRMLDEEVAAEKKAGELLAEIMKG